MAITPKKAASDRAHHAKLDVLKIQPNKAEGQQAWLLQAARERMAREVEQAPTSADQDN